MKTLLFVYNPKAGKGQIRSKLAEILNAFAEEGWLVTTCPTMGRGDATKFVRDLGSGYDRIVCAGGDGTLHEVIEGLMALPQSDRPPIGCIPSGTTNDFSRNLALPQEIDEIARTVAVGLPRPVDIGRLNDAYFTYVAAFGAFTSVSYDTPQAFKNTFGHLAYLLKGASELGNLKSYQLRLEHDGGVEEGSFLYGMVSNTVSVGGVLGLPEDEVALDDGLLEAILVREPQSVAQWSAALWALVSKTYSPESGVIGLHSSRYRISCDEPLPLTLDGEFGGAYRDAEIGAVVRPIEIIYGA